MDGTAAINHNLEALKRVLAGLVAMAGLGPEAPASGEARRTLPRHFRLAILRLLRPAEAAARRLIIASAGGLVVTLPPPRKRKPKPATAEPTLRRFGIAVVMSPADLAEAAAGARRAAATACPRTLCLPLFDPPRLPSAEFVQGSKGRRYVPAHAAPHILFPGSSPHPEVRAELVEGEPRRADDPIDATHLGRRLAALAAALDDLPGQARRFARWRALRARATGRAGRVSPLRSGRPPGGRLARFDPFATHRRNIREVDEILAHAHALALYALQRPDTS